MENLNVQAARIDNVRKVTKHDILREADAIWKEYAAISGLGGTINTDAYWDKVYKDHRDLCSSYPTVLKHMIFEGMYSSDAFARYLTKVEKAPWTNDAQRMDSYADYFVILARKLSPGTAKHELSKLRQEYRAGLQKEHDKFMEEAKRAQESVQKDAKKNIEVRKQALIDKLLTYAKGPKPDIPVPLCGICRKFVNAAAPEEIATFYHCDSCGADVCDGCFSPFYAPKCGHEISNYKAQKTTNSA